MTSVVCKPSWCFKTQKQSYTCKSLLNWPQFLWLVQGTNQTVMCFLCFAQINFCHMTSIKGFLFCTQTSYWNNIIKSQETTLHHYQGTKDNISRWSMFVQLWITRQSLRAERWGFPMATRSISSCYFYKATCTKRSHDQCFI